MDDYDYISEKMIQLAALGAKGDSEKVKIQALRLIRTLQAKRHPLADRLKSAMFSEAGEAEKPYIRKVKDSGVGVNAPPPIDKESGSELLNVEDPVTLPAGFIGSSEVKGPINLVLSERKKLKEMLAAGITPTSKLLFTGPPGVGKTVCAKYIAQQLKRPLLTLDLATVVSSLLGKTGNNIKSAINFSRERPCVLLIDEIDAVAKMRDDSSDVGETKRLVTVLLQELDQWGNENILIAATNHSHLLDPAIHRRFDQIIDFRRPSSDDLRKVGMALIKGRDDMPKEWIIFLTLIMEGTSYSDFQREVNNLRKSCFLYGEDGAQDYMRSLLERNSDKFDKDKRKLMAVKLVRESKLSQRAASRITSIARGTLKNALEAV
ncbi:ATP-binding protein [Halomonas sp. ATCH28]|uniref:ATP-binding protein n=1 Tax=Halomonas gemina TaxID=2945105 RepID=A0ABT0SWV2_9GAMM|nr:ATP-binding protein [Halomonas gemina]MCL7938781.1 ATP-binding protein [Halomonas gemina]